MTKKENIPQEILALAKKELDFWKQSDFPHAGKLEYLGKRKGIRYYTPYYPDAEIGFPKVYSIDSNGKCAIHKEFDALHILSSFPEK